MIKILCLEDKRIDAVGFWRVYRPFQVMRRLYPGIFDIEYKKEGLTFADIATYDVIFMTRPEKPEHIDFIKNAKLDGMGTVFICDADDDYFDLPVSHSMSAGFNASHKKRLKTTAAAWQLADAMWFSTDYLTNKYGKGLNRAQTMVNAVLPESLPNDPAPDRGHVMWRGHSIQNHDLMIEGVKTFDKIHKAANYFAWIGYMPPLPGWEKAVHLPETKEAQAQLYNAKKVLGETPSVLYPAIPNPADFMRMLHHDKFNVVWKPLISHGFNEAKSNIALIEATITGGYCLTNFAGRPMWENASSKYLPYDQGVALWESAKEQIKKEYNLYDTAHARAAVIFGLLGYSVPQKQIANAAS